MQLKKNQTNNNIILTLTEKSTITNPVYLFRFESDQTKQSYYCISTDLATDSEKVRFNKFSITEGVSNPTNGSLILGLQGRYHFYIYEQVSTTNLDPTGLDIVERGIMTLKGDIVSPYVSYESDIIYKVYE